MPPQCATCDRTTDGGHTMYKTASEDIQWYCIDHVRAVQKERKEKLEAKARAEVARPARNRKTKKRGR